jgi:hypothetical protein
MLLPFLTSVLLLAQGALGAPTSLAPRATVGKIRGVSSPIYHLYLQANSKNGKTATMFPSSQDYSYNFPFDRCRKKGYLR